MPGIKESSTSRLWLPLIALGELELGVELASNSAAQRTAVDPFLQA